MLSFPRAWVLALAAALPACGGDEPGAVATSGIPFDPQGHVDASSFVMVSEESDTVWFRSEIAETDSVARLVRVRRTPTGLDSLGARIDLTTQSPLSSHHLRHTTAGIVTATIEYGAGFEGQARLTLTSSEGRFVDNLRTPAPYLDAAQIPQTLAALRFGATDTLILGYVAPFERQVLNAQLVLGPRETIDLPSGPAAAYPLRLRVSGLDERLWFAATRDSAAGHRLLRWRDQTRGITWTRVEP